MPDANDRPAKRQRTQKPGGGGSGGGGSDNKANSKAKYRAQGHGSISASGLQSGDVGIFVTCDKGKEKACLREMEDLLGEEDWGFADDEAVQKGDDREGAVDGEGVEEAGKRQESGGIEDDIQKELAELAGEGVVGTKRKRVAQNGGMDSSKRKVGLITLDIPCVTFVRFPSQSSRDPVDVAKKLCRDARGHPERQRSRFVKRLTPLSKVRKVMNGGVEQLCEDVLPKVFGRERGWKYAVRVTVRNNNQIEKDQVIKTVAGAVRELGLEEKGATESRHRVDLKGYDKLVLVEIYRNIVGMAVVGAEWEGLRRFNLSELYAEGRTAAVDKSKQAVQLESEQRATNDSMPSADAAVEEPPEVDNAEAS
jgi:tRNA acetyltransferase TAN1